MEEVTRAPVETRRLAVLLYAGAAAAGTAYYLYQYSAQRDRKGGGHAGDGGPGTAATPLMDHGEGAAGEKHAQCEEEVQLRVRVRNSGDAVVVRVRPEKVDLTGHRGLVELPEEMRRCAVRVRELAVASSALETLPEWLGDLA